MLPGRRPTTRQRLVDQAGRARRRAHGRRPRPRGRRRSRGGRRRGRRSRRLPRRGSPRRSRRRARAARSRSVSIDGTAIKCDLLVMSGSPQPNYKLLAQAGARVEYDERARHLRPDRPPGERRGGRRRHRRRRRRRRCRARSSTTAATSASSASARTSDDEGPQVRDRRGLRLDRALEALHDRDDGPVPGPALPARTRSASTRRRPAIDENTIGTTTARPPWHAGLDGPARRPRRTSRASARRCTTATRSSARTMMWTGAWRRPHSYGDAGDEAQHVHEDARPDRRLDARQDPRQGPRRRRVPRPRSTRTASPTSRPGGSATACSRATPAGSWTTARSAASTTSTFYVTTTSTGAGRRLPVVHVVERRLVHGRRSSSNVTRRARRGQRRRPERARGDAARSPTTTSRTRASRTSTRSRSRVAGVPCARPAHRLRRRARLRAPLPEPARRARLGRALRAGAELGIAPFGLEPQRILRLEKGHIIVGQDTDSESNLLEAGDAVDRRSSTRSSTSSASGRPQQVAERGARVDARRLRQPERRDARSRAAQVVIDGALVGRVTSVRRCSELGKVIGMALVPPELAVEGGRVRRPDRRHARADAPCTCGAFYDPDGEKLRS